MRIIFTLFYLLLATNIASAHPFYIKGTLTGNASPWVNKVYLKTITNMGNMFAGSRLTIIDSADIDGAGNFAFTNSEIIDSELTIYRLDISQIAYGGNGADLIMTGIADNYTFLFLNKKSQIQFAGKYEGFNYYFQPIQLDEVNLSIRNFYDQRKSILKTHEAIGAVYHKLKSDKKRENEADSLSTILDSLSIVKKDLARIFADTVADPYASVLAFNYTWFEGDSLYAARQVKRYQKEIPNSKYTRQITDYIVNKEYTLATGSMAPGFTLPDKDGNQHSLSAYKGKYILVDFWASWCIPCRVEAKETIQPLYAHVHDKGFEVIGISLDLDRQSWINAYMKDGSNWLQLNDMKAYRGSAPQAYLVDGLPTTYIIGPDGTILAKNLRGKELSCFITQQLK